MDDYGANWDTGTQRWLAFQNLWFMLSPETHPLPEGHNRFYGVAFQIPLLLAEWALSSDHSRDIILSRHLVSHLFFLAAALCCSLLTYRLFNNRLLAFIALLLFLLHPRLYALSFTDSKDLPFLSMFMICLYLTHKAFAKDTLGAFLILGVGVGVLVNIRIMGIMLFPAVLAMRALDMLPAPSREMSGRAHVAATGGAFIAASVSVYYAVSPSLWTDPITSLTTLIQTFKNPPMAQTQMFQGNLVHSSHTPPHFVPTWIAITTPPTTLLLMAAGVVVTCAHSLARPLLALQNTDLRFRALLVACLASPVAVVVLANADAYDGVRTLSFLYAPMCLLAVTGLHWISRTLHKLPGPWKAGGYFLVCLGMVATAAQMVLIHPRQMSYFNFLVDRHTPEHLRSQYELDPRHDACREGLVHLLQRYPHTTIKVLGGYAVDKGWHTLPKEDRERIIQVKEDADFRILCGYMLREASANIQNETDTVFTKKLYNNTVVAVKSSSCRSGEPILWGWSGSPNPWDILAEAWKARQAAH